MRRGATILVKRLAHGVARPGTRPRVSVAYHALTLDEALIYCRNERTHAAKHRATWPFIRPAVLWIERTGARASRKRDWRRDAPARRGSA